MEFFTFFFIVAVLCTPISIFYLANVIKKL